MQWRQCGWCKKLWSNGRPVLYTNNRSVKSNKSKWHLQMSAYSSFLLSDVTRAVSQAQIWTAFIMSASWDSECRSTVLVSFLVTVPQFWSENANVLVLIFPDTLLSVMGVFKLFPFTSDSSCSLPFLIMWSPHCSYQDRVSHNCCKILEKSYSGPTESQDSFDPIVIQPTRI